MNAAAPRADDYLVPWTLRELDLFSAGRKLRVLDIGCGDGLAAAAIAARGHEVTAFDRSDAEIDRAKKAYPTLDASVRSIYDGDLVERLGPVDCIVSLEVVEHLIRPKKLFDLSRALLGPSGLLLLTTPYHGYAKNLAISFIDGWDNHFDVAWEGGHIKFFSERTLEKMARDSGFRSFEFSGLGRVPYFWKSITMAARP